MNTATVFKQSIQIFFQNFFSKYSKKVFKQYSGETVVAVTAVTV